MIKVSKKGPRRIVVRPQDGVKQQVVPVTFIEEGRASANADLSNSSDVLSRALGEETGLPTLRTHTQNVLVGAADKLKEGQAIQNLFINRTLTSLPSMRQQVNAAARLIDGRPTYFKTAISDRQEPDTDQRMSNETLAALAPELFRAASVQSAEVWDAEAFEQQNTEEGVAASNA